MSSISERLLSLQELSPRSVGVSINLRLSSRSLERRSRYSFRNGVIVTRMERNMDTGAPLEINREVELHRGLFPRVQLQRIRLLERQPDQHETTSGNNDALAAQTGVERNIESGAPQELNREVELLPGSFPRVQLQRNRLLVRQPDQHETTSGNNNVLATQTGLALASNSGTRVNFNQDGLLRCYECYVCHRFLSSPVRTCVNGHLLCSYCYDRMNHCGLCRGSFLRMRVRGVEEMLENVYVPCFYEEEGCTLILAAREGRLHAQNCMYRPIKCDANCEPMNCVDKLIDFRLYRSHLLEYHNILHIHSGDQNRLEIKFTDENINYNGGMWALQCYSYDGNTFVVRSCLENRRFFTWCTIMGTEDDAKKYRMNINLQAALDENLEESTVGRDLPVYSPHIQNLEDLTNARGTSFQISLASLRRTIIVSIQEPQISFLPSEFRYRWNVLYEFCKVPNNGS